MLMENRNYGHSRLHFGHQIKIYIYIYENDNSIYNTRGGAVTAVWKTLCKLCQPIPLPAMGVRLPFFWPSRPCGRAGWLAMLLVKAGDVETNPGPTITRKLVWMYDICHRHIQVGKQISIGCNRTEHWVHLRCAGIRLAQYTNTWRCHNHKESRLTTHTHTNKKQNTTSPSQTQTKAAHPLSPNTTHTTATKTQTHIPLSLCSSRIGKAQTQSCQPLTPNTSHTAQSQTHIHVTHYTYTYHHTNI